MAEIFVLDNSVSMSWCFADEGDDYSVTVLKSLESAEALAPAVWPLEAGNALMTAEHRGRLTGSGTVRFLEMLGALPIRVEQESPARMFGEIVSLAREHSLSTYDASYMDIAMRHGLPLATRDERLVKAAKECGVPLYRPSSAKSG